MKCYFLFLFVIAPVAILAGAAVDEEQLAERLSRFEDSINNNFKTISKETEENLEQFKEFLSQSFKDGFTVDLGLKSISNLEKTHFDISTSPQTIPKEATSAPIKKKKRIFNSNELKPGIPDDTPKRLYRQGLESKIKLCEICRGEMDQEREKLLKCRGKECQTAVHKKCVGGWTKSRMGFERTAQHCSFCSSRSVDGAKYRFWCEIE
jgi:hypothetical protein